MSTLPRPLHLGHSIAIGLYIFVLVNKNEACLSQDIKRTFWLSRNAAVMEPVNDPASFSQESLVTDNTEDH